MHAKRAGHIVWHKANAVNCVMFFIRKEINYNAIQAIVSLLLPCTGRSFTSRAVKISTSQLRTGNAVSTNSFTFHRLISQRKINAPVLLIRNELEHSQPHNWSEDDTRLNNA